MKKAAKPKWRPVRPVVYSTDCVEILTDEPG